MLNTGILKAPSNWFLVAFVMVLLSFIFHINISKRNSQ